MTVFDGAAAKSSTPVVCRGEDPETGPLFGMFGRVLSRLKQPPQRWQLGGSMSFLLHPHSFKA